MSDESKVGGGDAQPPKADATSEIELTVRGKTVAMPIEKVKTLAQQGLSQQQKSEALAAERRELEEKKAGYSEYQKLQAHLQANPTVAQAVQRALQDPHAVIAGVTPAGGGDEPDDDLDLPGGTTSRSQEQPVHNQELAQLRRELAELKAKDQERDARDATTHQDQAINAEVGEYPWLESDKVRSMARAQIAAALAADPSADLASVTAVVANDIKSVMEEAKTSRVETVPSKRRLSTERPTRAAPGITVDKPPTKEDLDNGNLLKMTKDAARAFGLPV